MEYTDTYLKLINYLKVNFERPSLESFWTEEDNRNFIAFIKEHFKEDYLYKIDNLLEIKQVFKDYFEQVGYLLFQIKNLKIRFRVFPYKSNYEDENNLEIIKTIIDDHKHLVVVDYNGNPNQKLIKGELKDKIYAHVETIADEKFNKKDIVKYFVRKSFDLKDTDIVILKSESIFMKQCEFKKKHTVLINNQSLIEDRRYEGVDKNELESFYKENFSAKENKHFFIIVASTFVDRYFLEKQIDNLEYEKNVFSYIKSIIAELLLEKFDDCETFFKGLAGYIFRNHFEDVFKNIAELILIELTIVNDYILNFLKYYSLDIVVLNGTKYKVPSLEAENGLRWNVVSMISIVKPYIKTKSTSKELKQEMMEKEQEIQKLFDNGLSPVENNKKRIEKKNKLELKLSNDKYRLDSTYDILQITKDKEKKERLNVEIAFLEDEIKSLKKEIKILEKYDAGKINQFSILEKELDTMLRQVQREESILQENEKSFQSIKTALVKALISKKEKIH